MDAPAADGTVEWSTALAAERDRFAYWREIICAAYVRLRADPVDRGPFDGTVRLSSWREVQISHVAAHGQVVTRPPGGSEDDCLVSLQLSGTGRVTQDQRTAVLRAGDLALYDASRPYELAFDQPFEQIVVKVPRAQMLARNIDVRSVTAVRCDGSSGLGAVATTFVQSLSQNGSSIPDGMRPRLGGQAVDCLAAALADAVNGAAIDQSVRTADRQRVLAHVAANLTSPDLSVSSIARAFRRSPRSLQKLFAEHEQQLGEHIRLARLHLAADALRDPLRATHSIGRIATDCGFSDGTHFARAFKAQYGCSPRAWRQGDGS
jgi:AraC-like DNA-binding protein